MSKVSFRARQIDFNKPLPIIRSDSEINSDISENALVNRGVPVLPSGMEKEEENEHHLVEVLHALQSKKASDVVIPVPEIEEDTDAYFSLYEKGFSPPNHFIHIRTIVLAEEEPVEYDMDSEDEAWLSKNEEMNITPDQFESMIYTLERGCGQKVINLDEAKCLLQNFDTSLVIAIYDYWLTKRVQSRQPLILTVRQEKRNNDQANDPYIAFRRRTERMQTRKNRKNDEYSYEKMLILREQMESLGDIIERLVKRECIKKELVDAERKIFSSRYYCKDFEGYLINEISSQCNRFSKEKSYANDSSTVNKNYLQESTKRQRNNIKHQSSKKKRPSKKVYPSIYNSKFANSSGGELSDEENIFSSENESQSLTSPASSTSSYSSFIRQQGCKYLRPTSRLDYDSLRKPSMPFSLSHSRLFYPKNHPYLAYSLAVQQKNPSFTGYARRRIGRGGRLIIDRVPCEADILESSIRNLPSINLSEDIGSKNLDCLSSRVKFLTAQTLSLRQGQLADESTLGPDLYRSISNRLWWSEESNNWKIDQISASFKNIIGHVKQNMSLSLNQISNSSSEDAREMRLKDNFDDRPSLERKLKSDPEYSYPSFSKHDQIKSDDRPPFKTIRLDTNRDLDNHPMTSCPEESSIFNKNRKNRLIRNSSPVTSNINVGGSTISVENDSNPNLIPASTAQPQSFVTINSNSKDISSGQSPKNWVSSNSGGNSHLRRCISISSKLTGNNSLDIDSNQTPIPKANGSSNYCFFVPTPTNNSQTASNV